MKNLPNTQRVITKRTQFNALIPAAAFWHEIAALALFRVILWYPVL
jgi:hypothetical protein